MSTPELQIPTTEAIPEAKPPVEATAPGAPTEKAPGPAPAALAPGYDQVDFSLVPEEHRQAFEDRYGRLYGQVKQAQRERAEERKYYQGLESKLDKFINTEETARQLSKIELMGEKAKKLFEENQHEEGIELLRKIVQAERDMPAKKESQPVQSTDAPFTPEETSHLSDFIQATPWAKAGSPYHTATKDTIASFLSTGMPLIQAVEQTRELMGALINSTSGATKPTQETIAQAVLGTSRGSNANRSTSSGLDEMQQAVARRFFPKITPSEAYARYARNLTDE